MDDAEHCYSCKASSGKRRHTGRYRSSRGQRRFPIPREEHVYITERTGRKYHKRRSCIGLN